MPLHLSAVLGSTGREAASFGAATRFTAFLWYNLICVVVVATALLLTALRASVAGSTRPDGSSVVVRSIAGRYCLTKITFLRLSATTLT